VGKKAFPYSYPTGIGYPYSNCQPYPYGRPPVFLPPRAAGFSWCRAPPPRSSRHVSPHCHLRPPVDGRRAPAGCWAGEHQAVECRPSEQALEAAHRAGERAPERRGGSEHRRPHSGRASTGRATPCDNRAEGGSHTLDGAALSGCTKEREYGD
jgi:hypothetical protein